jgi:hypothetical protein
MTGSRAAQQRRLLLPRIEIALPAWIDELVDLERTYGTTEERMRLAIDLSRENILRSTGGPFGAAIFELESGRLVSVGVNLVVPCNNSVLHGEMVAFMMAEARLGTYSLSAPSLPAYGRDFLRSVRDVSRRDALGRCGASSAVPTAPTRVKSCSTRPGFPGIL